MDMSTDYDSIDDGDLLGDETLDDREALEARAYAAFREGDLQQAVALFGELIALAAEVPYLHYMRGLAHKYLRDWPPHCRTTCNQNSCAASSMKPPRECRYRRHRRR